LEAAGNCYVAGGFDDTIRIASTNLTASANEHGFLAKFNSAGALQWARQVKGPSLDGGRVGVDAAGNCHLVGSVFSGVLDFGGLSITNHGASGLYLAKYNTHGQLQWVQQAEGSGSLIYNEGGCAIDQAGNCYIPGIFTGTATFGGTRSRAGAGGTLLSPNTIRRGRSNACRRRAGTVMTALSGWSWTGRAIVMWWGGSRIWRPLGPMCCERRVTGTSSSPS
jgi:hypothetical protein